MLRSINWLVIDVAGR